MYLPHMRAFKKLVGLRQTIWFDLFFIFCLYSLFILIFFSFLTFSLIFIGLLTFVER